MMTGPRSSWLLAGAMMALVIAVSALLWPADRASAHAVLERSLPVQNQKLATPPERVETWYSEPLERSLTTLRVVDTGGGDVATGETIFSDDPVYAAIALPPSLGPGIYTLIFQNVSQVDGHSWAGSFAFIVLNADGSVPAGSAYEGPGGGQGFLPGIGDTTLRWFGLLAAVALVGATSFFLLVAKPAAEFLDPPERWRVDDAALGLAADIGIMAVPVLVISLLGQLFLLVDRLGGLDILGDLLFTTRTGQLWLAKLGLSIALLLLFLPAAISPSFRQSRQATLLAMPALLGAVGLLMTYSLGSHGATGGGEFWSVAADFVHFLATALWLGALLQLPLLFWWTRQRLEDPKRLLYQANALDRFSWLAAVSVILIIGTGTFNGFVQLPRLPALWDTTYGRVLIAKLALILPLLGVAAINALFLKPALVRAIDALHNEEANEPLRQDERARQQARLVRIQRALPLTTIAEFVLGAAVLVSVAILAQSTTAKGELRQEAGRPTGDFAADQQTGDVTVNLLIKPFGLSVNTFTVTLTPAAGAELGEVLGVKLVASYDDPNAPPSAGRTGTDQDLDSTAENNVWRADAALLTQPGDWRIETRIRRRGADDSRVVFPLSGVGGYLARAQGPGGLFDLPFTFVDWNVVAGGAMIALGISAFLVWHNRPASWQRATSASVGLAGAFALTAGAVFILGVHAHEPVGRTTNPVPATGESIARGQELFLQNCVVCHGQTGLGDGPAASGLEVKPPRYSDHIPYHNDGTIWTWITEGIPIDSEKKNMPPFKDDISETDRWNIVNYLKEAFGSGDFTPVLPPDLVGGATETPPLATP